ncbi:hypothetical protein ACP4OV_017378 [Aristida adscensionis]
MPVQGGAGGFLENVLVGGGLLVVQCLLAGYVVFVNHLLALGADPLAVVAVSSAALAVFFLPFAVAFERKKWPSKVSATLVVQFVLIALGGNNCVPRTDAAGDQEDDSRGRLRHAQPRPLSRLHHRSLPQLEKFDRACRYTQAKILGTLVCLAGATAMSLLQSPSSSSAPSTSSSGSPAASGYGDWLLGCSFLLAAVIAFSLYTVLLAATLASFPAPLTTCAATSGMGAALTAALQAALEGGLGVGSPAIGATLVAGIVVLLVVGGGGGQGGVMAGACIVFQTWCIGRKGPLFVSVFGPVQTVCSGVLSAALFGQTLSLGSLAGIVLMFCGLYIVLWAKSKESPTVEVEDGGVLDSEKALLS